MFCRLYFFFLSFVFSLFFSTQDRVSTDPKQNKTNKQKLYTKYTDNMDTMNKLCRIARVLGWRDGDGVRVRVGVAKKSYVERGEGKEPSKNINNKNNNKIIINIVRGTESCSWGSGLEKLNGWIDGWRGGRGKMGFLAASVYGGGVRAGGVCMCASHWVPAAAAQVDRAHPGRQ